MSSRSRPLRIACVGGGPGGLYLALLMKRADPRHEILVIERNGPEDTFGFGVVFSDATMAGIAAADADAFDAIGRHLVHWDDIAVHFDGTTTRSTGHGFSGMSRHKLLHVLQEHVNNAGVTIEFDRDVASLDELADFDLIVGSDGVNSTVRGLLHERVDVDVDVRPNRFVWLGTSKPFAEFTFYFRHDAHGLWRVHAYQYAADRSTFIVECRDETWHAAGLDQADESTTIEFLERLFAENLDGHRLIANKSVWRQFPTIRVAPWCCSAMPRIPRTSQLDRAHGWRWKTRWRCATRSSAPAARSGRPSTRTSGHAVRPSRACSERRRRRSAGSRTPNATCSCIRCR